MGTEANDPPDEKYKPFHFSSPYVDYTLDRIKYQPVDQASPMLTMAPTAALAAIHGLSFSTIEPSHAVDGVTFVARNDVDRIDRSTVHGIHIHTLNYNNPTIRAIVHWAQSNHVPFWVYDSTDDWIHQRKTAAIELRQVNRLLATHSERWWRQRSSPTMRAWIELLYGSNPRALSRDARRVLNKIDDPSIDQLIIFDQLVHQHVPTVSDQQATLIIDRQLLAHSIRTYAEFAQLIQRRWRQFIGNQREVY